MGLAAGLLNRLKCTQGIHLTHIESQYWCPIYINPAVAAQLLTVCTKHFCVLLTSTIMIILHRYTDKCSHSQNGCMRTCLQRICLLSGHAQC